METLYCPIIHRLKIEYFSVISFSETTANVPDNGVKYTPAGRKIRLQITEYLQPDFFDNGQEIVEDSILSLLKKRISPFDQQILGSC